MRRSFRQRSLQEVRGPRAWAVAQGEQSGWMQCELALVPAAAVGSPQMELVQPPAKPPHTRRPGKTSSATEH